MPCLNNAHSPPHNVENNCVLLSLLKLCDLDLTLEPRCSDSPGIAHITPPACSIFSKTKLEGNYGDVMAFKSGNVVVEAPSEVTMTVYTWNWAVKLHLPAAYCHFHCISYSCCCRCCWPLSLTLSNLLV